MCPGRIVLLLGPEEGVAPDGEVVAGGPGDQVIRVLCDELALGALQPFPLHPKMTESLSVPILWSLDLPEGVDDQVVIFCDVLTKLVIGSRFLTLGDHRTLNSVTKGETMAPLK